MVWVTLFTCLLIHNTLKSVFVIKMSLHYETIYKLNSLRWVELEWTASTKVLMSVLKCKDRKPYETTKLKASNNAIASTSKTVLGDVENVDFPIRNYPIEVRKHKSYPIITLFWNIVASTLHFNTPFCGLTHVMPWFGLCPCGFALCIHIHSWSESFALEMITTDVDSRDSQRFMFLLFQILHKSIATFCYWGGNILFKIFKQ